MTINLTDTANKASPTTVISKYTTQITTSYRNAYFLTWVYALCPPIKPSMICYHLSDINILSFIGVGCSQFSPVKIILFIFTV